jgi:hypothetical protein
MDGYSFSNNDSSFIYDGPSDSLESSITILANSLAPNQTYQFRVTMNHSGNSSYQATGYVTVKVEDSKPQLIVIG